MRCAVTYHALGAPLSALGILWDEAARGQGGEVVRTRPSRFRIRLALPNSSMMLTGSLKDYRELAAANSTPILLSERMAGPFEFEALLESGVARYVWSHPKAVVRTSTA